MESTNNMAQQPKVTYIRSPEQQEQPVPTGTPNVTYIRPPSKAEEFAYGFEASKTDIGYGLDYIRAKTPFGSFRSGPEGFKYYTAKEIYGDDFEDLTEDQRRERILQIDKEEVEQNNLAVTLYGKQDSPSSLAGGFVGSLASPTTLIPIGGARAGYKAVALGSAILGSEYNILEQLATKGEVDLKETGAVGGISAVGGVGLLGAGRATAKGYNKLKQVISKKDKATPEQILEAKTKVDEIDEVTMEAVEQDISKEDMPKFYQDRLNMSADEIAETVALSPDKPQPFTKVESFNAKILDNLGSGEEVATKYVGVKDILLPQADVIRDISPQLSRRIRDYHRLILEGRANLKPIDSLYDAFKKMPSNVKEDVNDLLLNLDATNISKAKKIFTDIDSKYGKDFDDWFEVLRKQRSRIVDGSKGKIKLPDNPYYLRREIKDYKQFRKDIGKPLANRITTALNDRAKRLKVNKADLSDEDRDFISNAIVRGLTPITDKKGRLIAKSSSPDAKPSYLKGRKIGYVSRDLQKHYYNPFEASQRYLEQSERMIRKQELFGKFSRYKGNTFDVDNSVGNLMNELEQVGNLSNTDIDVVRNVFDATFKTGEQSVGKVASAYKQLTYASFLANYATSIVQLADAGITAWVHGFRHTLGSMLSGGKNKLSVEELFMLDSTIAENFSSGVKTSKSLDLLMKASGFKMFDKWGKDLVVNAAWRKAQSQVKTPKGIVKLRKEVGDAFPNDFDAFVDELSKGQITDRTKSYLFSKLSDQHLTSPFEMPLKYAQMKDGRVLYTLKSFTLKQAALMRTRIANEWNTGNKKQAMRNAISFMLLVPTSNMTIQLGKDLMLGRDIDLEGELGDRYFDNIFKVFASSQYAVNKLFKQGNLSEFVMDTFAPPLSVLDNAGAGAITLIQEGEFDPKLVKDLPFAGKFYYNFFGGGLEEYNEKKEAREFKELYGED